MEGKEILNKLKNHDIDYNVILDYIKSNIDMVLKFNWTIEEFELLNSIDLFPIMVKIIQSNNIPLIMYASKHHNTIINLQLDATPNNITSYLDGNDIVTIYLEDPDVDMLKDILIPCPLIKNVKGSSLPYSKFYELYLKGYSDEELFYWTGKRLEYVKKMKFWSLVSKDYINQCAKKCNSYPMLSTYPELLYSSMRPRTDMSMFQTPLSNFYDDMDGSSNYINVTRYSSGMSSGLYNTTNRPSNVCGYFYYYEPESTTFLKYNKSLTAFNKTQAAKMLIENYDNISLNHFSDDDKLLNKLLYDKLTMLLRRVNKHLTNHIDNIIPDDLEMTAKEYHEYSGINVFGSPQNLGDRKVYIGGMIGLYALEDKFDQPLCRMASLLGYDIVILTNMVGSHQVVKEILDTRSNSFNYLYYHR